MSLNEEGRDPADCLEHPASSRAGPEPEAWGKRPPPASRRGSLSAAALAPPEINRQNSRSCRLQYPPPPPPAPITAPPCPPPSPGTKRATLSERAHGPDCIREAGACVWGWVLD